MPSGCLITFAPSAYSKITVSRVKAAVARRCRRRAALTVTATAADTIMAKMPVA